VLCPTLRPLLVIRAGRTNPVDAASRRLSLNVWNASAHAKNDRATPAPLGEVFAADAMAVGTLFVEEPHSAHPVWMYSIYRRERSMVRALEPKVALSTLAVG
jgi:hypothetical protein